jgi:hypothetical protein
VSTPLAYGWEILFRLACQERRGDGYQEMFSQIMERRDAGFQRIRPWGRHGDRKNDGWSPSRRLLFQCYAPSVFSADALAAKLVADYEGAIAHWSEYFDTWVFVHDDLRGMSPAVAAIVADLDSRSQNVTCRAWGMSELREEFACLTDADREAILGPVLTALDFLSVDAARLRPLIDQLGYLAPDPAAPVNPVPARKIEANDLLPAQVEFLKLGSSRAPLVEYYLSNAYVLPSHADGIAEAVSSRYASYRDEGRPSAETFDLLWSWICGAGILDSTVRANALAVLAYFFERCHIFEVPGEVDP